MENQVQVLELTRLQLEFEVGTNALGEPIFKRKTLSGIDHTVDAVALHKAANAYVSLQQFPISTVRRLDTWAIEQN